MYISLAYSPHENMIKRGKENSSNRSLQLKMPPYSEIAMKYIIQNRTSKTVSNRALVAIYIYNIIYNIYYNIWKAVWLVCMYLGCNYRKKEGKALKEVITPANFKYICWFFLIPYGEREYCLLTPSCHCLLENQAKFCIPNQCSTSKPDKNMVAIFNRLSSHISLYTKKSTKDRCVCVSKKTFSNFMFRFPKIQGYKKWYTWGNKEKCTSVTTNHLIVCQL